jgi:hypothetical protein
VSPCVNKNDRALHIKIKIKIKQWNPYGETSLYLSSCVENTQRETTSRAFELSGRANILPAPATPLG